MALTGRCHGGHRGEGLEHGGGQRAHRLCGEVGCWREGSGRHGGPLLLGGGKEVGLPPDERLASRQHLGHWTKWGLHPEGQWRLRCEGLLRPVAGGHRPHRHVTWLGRETGSETGLHIQRLLVFGEGVTLCHKSNDCKSEKHLVCQVKTTGIRMQGFHLGSATVLSKLQV